MANTMNAWYTLASTVPQYNDLSIMNGNITDNTIGTQLGYIDSTTTAGWSMPVMSPFTMTPIGARPDGGKTLELIKKSVRQIKDEAISEEAKNKVISKAERLEKLGAIAQATILRAEANLRVRVARVAEWDYKVLPYEELKKYDGSMQGHYMIKIHVDSLKDYTGSTATSETKPEDKVIPDFVLDELEKAQDRKVFDDYAVLWVEKVKDPLLLGVVKGCKDYFLIAEWGDDVKFTDIVKGKGK